MEMSEEYRWLSPEKVMLNFNLAGVGSRFAAGLIDSGIQSVLMFAFFIAAMDFLPDESIWGAVLLLLGVFAILYGYFIFFETLWNGQTPGKRVMHLRVIQVDGSSVTFVKVLIRNIARLIDALPVIYAVGILAVFFSQKKQRLGDMAAGTLVIKETTETAPASVHFPLKETPWSGAARLHLHKISEDEFAVLKKYLLRRDALNLTDKVAWDRKLTLFYAEKLGLNPEETGHPEDFLTQVAALYQNR
jgi:uncharacterized RDD family membrane protein YckC